MSKTMNKASKLSIISLAVIVLLATLAVMPDVHAAPLTGVTDTPNPATAGETATHAVAFTTATDGAIKSVDITFPADFDVSGVGYTAGTSTNIGDGTPVAAGQTVTYTVTADPAPVVTAGTAVEIPLTGIVNNKVAATTYIVTDVETKDAASATIDGPTDSATFAITAGPLVKLQLLVPGETTAPGTPTGKTGAPVTQDPGGAFNVTVNAVDDNWNLVNTVTDIVHFTSTDTAAGLPADTPLAAGTLTVPVILNTVGVQTVTASDVTDATVTSDTSGPIPVKGMIVDQLNSGLTTKAGTGKLAVLGLNLSGTWTLQDIKITYTGRNDRDITVVRLYRVPAGENYGYLLKKDGHPGVQVDVVDSNKSDLVRDIPLDTTRALNLTAPSKFVLAVDVASGASAGLISSLNLNVVEARDATPNPVIVDRISTTDISIDGKKPVFDSASYDQQAGRLTITFNEKINVVDRDGKQLRRKVDLSDIKIHEKNETGKSVFDLNGAELQLADGTKIKIDEDYGSEAEADGVAAAADIEMIYIKLNDSQLAGIQTVMSKTPPESGVLIGGLSIYAGAVKDFFDNSIDTDEKNDIAIVGAFPAPTLKTAKYNAISRVLSLTFDRLMDADPNKMDLSKIEISNLSQTINLAGAGVTKEKTLTVKLNMSPAQHEILAGARIDKPQVTVKVGAIEAVDETKALAADQGPMIVLVTPPLLSAGTAAGAESYYDSPTNTLRLTFSEKIVIGAIVASKITLANSSTGGDYFELGGEELVPQTDRREVEFSLTDDHRNKVLGWKNIYVRLEDSAVKDVNNNYNAALPDGKEIRYIGVKPILSATSYYTHATKTLTLIFNKPIKSVEDYAKIKLEITNPADSFVLKDNYDSKDISGSTIIFVLKDTYRDKVSKWGGDALAAGTTRDLQVTLLASAVKDTLDQTNDAGTKTIGWSKDGVPPILTAAKYVPDLDRITLVFSEKIRSVDATKLKVFKLDGSSSDLANDADAPVIKDNIVTIGSLEDQEAYILDGHRLDIDAEAVRDLAYVPIAESDGNTITSDEVKPALSETGNTYVSEIAEQRGYLTLTFTEAIDVTQTEIDFTKITLSNASSGGDSFFLPLDTTIETTEPSTAVKFKLSELSAKRVFGWQSVSTTLYIQLGEGAVKDIAGNPIDAMAAPQKLDSWTKEVGGPVLTEAEYDHSSQILTLKFDKTLKLTPLPNTAHVMSSKITLANDQFAGDTITLEPEELEDAGDQFDSTDLKFKLTSKHKQIISVWGSPIGNNKDKLYVGLDYGAVIDAGGTPNDLMAARLPITFESADDPDRPGKATADSAWQKDGAPPVFDSAKYDANTKKLKLTYNELLDVDPETNVNQAKLTIKAGTGPANPVSLGGSSVTKVGQTKTVTITLTPAQDGAVQLLPRDGDGKLKLDVSAKAVRDLAGNYNVDKTDYALPYTADESAPTFDKDKSSYTYIQDSEKGRLILGFNESVPLSTVVAGDITLLNSAAGEETFVLRADELIKSEAADKILFRLNDEHWNTVAGWDKVFVQFNDNAVADVVGNGIAAVSPTEITYNKDTEKPTIVMPDPLLDSGAYNTDITITAKAVTDNVAVDKVRLYYRVGNFVKYVDMNPTTGDSYEGTIPASDVSGEGLSYYVWAKDTSGNIREKEMRKGKSDGDIIGPYQNITVKDAVITLLADTLPVFASGDVPSKYRMISVPIDKEVASTDLFAPFGIKSDEWIAWKYTGSQYLPGHSDGGFTLNPGEAAWIGATKPGAELQVTGDTPDVTTGYKITLHQGWNQIGNPFNFLRSWDDDTIDLNDVGNTIYWFTGETSDYSFASLDPRIEQTVNKGSWKSAGDFEGAPTGSGWPGTLDPWAGYWLYAYRDGATITIDPLTPSKVSPVAPPTAPSVQVASWSVKFKAESGGKVDATKLAGVVADASDNVDKYDVMDLPLLPGGTVRLSFVTEDGVAYLQDMKSPADEMSWQLRATSVTDTPVTLKFDASAVPSEYRTVLLMDTTTDTATDLRKVATYVYKPSEQIRTFKLIISKAHPETYIVPKRSVLLQNYPNPFNPETWVPYRLAKAGDVTIKIYNVAGQLVRTLELGHREAGSYTVRERAAYWDGRNVTGERVASGIYFYYIQSGSFHATKRMVIVK